MNSKFLLICALMLGSMSNAFGQQTTAVKESTFPAKNDSGYLIGVGDEVTGRVLGEGQFDFVAEVDEDGKLQIPFFDSSILAKCRTEKELRANVTQILGKYLKSPQISVRVTQRRSRPPVIVTGEVRSPQQVELRREARLLDLLSQAGSVTEDASGMIQVFRTQKPMCLEKSEDDWRENSDNSLDVPSRMYSLKSLGQNESNPIIQSGDVIIVQKARPVYITGEVNSPQGLLLKEGGTSLLDAIAKVNGVNRQAKTKDIKIFRVKPNAAPTEPREVISVNYDSIKKGEQKDILLQPYDIIEVGKAKKSIAQTVLELATGLGTNAINMAGQGLPARILY